MNKEMPSWIKKLKEITFKEPKRYYPKTLKSASLELGGCSLSRKEILDFIKKEQYVCYFCHGREKLYHPDDCDPIEGYKLAHRRVVCSVCQGKGTLPKAEFKKWHDIQEQEYAKRLENYKNAFKLVTNILKDLTDIELYYLNIHFRPDFYGTYDY